MKTRTTLCIAALGAIMVTQSYGATLFTETLTTAPTNFEGTIGGAGDIVISGSGATAGGVISGDAGRSWYTTTDDDYATISFTATVNFTLVAGQELYFGLGSGTIGSWGAPDVDQAVDALGFEVTTTGGAKYKRTADGSGNTFSGLGLNVGAGSHTASMTYDPTAGTNGNLTLTIGGNSTTLALTNQFDSSEASHIWVGGGDGTVLSNFSVVPEPSSTALLGLGGLALILRRRK